jgi:Zn-dependent peptidase ImmA (M78 family)/transcriptional regulator with XRE-family HTH domain
MIGERLAQLRLARNLTLDALSAKMGGIVTKQALSKYEQNQAQPSPLVLTKLSAALGVKANYFLSPPQITVKFVAYRKATSLLPREKARVESVVTQCLEDRIRVQTLIGQIKTDVLPWNELAISSLEDTERQASHMRKLWELGSSPISDVVGTFEEHQLCVLSIEADEKFDGMSALGYDTSGNILAGAIVSRQDVPGERQRLNLTHELGHLVLKVPESIDEEKAAFRFGSAFLAPAERLVREVGAKRSYIHISELLILKKQFGISIQALLHRMLELGIINDSYYRRWCVYINKTGWKKQEPDELVRETPQWLTRNLSRLVGEGAMAREEAERMLGTGIDVEEPTNIVQRHAFLKLPMDKRRQMLADQAKLLSGYYEKEAEYLTSEDLINDY